MTSRLAAAYAAIDLVNHDDPHLVSVRGTTSPLAEVHGQLATEWVTALRSNPDQTLLLAARAHHLRRWAVPRASYPQGRAGYLRWRKDQKARHAEEVQVILRETGFDEITVARVQALIRRDNLATDPDSQLMEDAACLVFLETQLADLATKVDDDRLLEIIRKAARKMSPTGLGAVSIITLSESAQMLVERALAR